eukprot:3676610-Lingulodinium_polyedra.AAC.1
MYPSRLWTKQFYFSPPPKPTSRGSGFSAGAAALAAPRMFRWRGATSCALSARYAITSWASWDTST